MRPVHYVAVLVVIVIILACIVFASVKDSIPGFWFAPDEFVAKMGLLTPNKTIIGAMFRDQLMLLTVSVASVTFIQKYRFMRDGEAVSLKFIGTLNEGTSKVGALFEDGAYKINIDGNSLIIYDNKRVIIHLYRVK